MSCVVLVHEIVLLAPYGHMKLKMEINKNVGFFKLYEVKEVVAIDYAC